MNYLLDKYKRLMIPCVVFGALNCLLRREDLIYVLHWFTFGVFTKKMFFPLANAEKSVAAYMGGYYDNFNIVYYHRGMYICRE